MEGCVEGGAKAGVNVCAKGGVKLLRPGARLQVRRVVVHGATRGRCHGGGADLRGRRGRSVFFATINKSLFWRLPFGDATEAELT